MEARQSFTKSRLTLIALFVTAIMFLLPVGSRAQGIHFGVKGGYNITQMYLGSKIVNTENKNGFFIGPTLKASLPMGIGIDAAGLYDERDMEVEGTTIKQKSFNVPVNLRFNIGLSRLVGVYMVCGPQFSFTLGDKEFDLSETYQTAAKFRLRDAYMSVNMGVGLYLTRHIEIGALYNIAVARTGQLKDYNLNDALNSHSHAWQISAAFYF